jgi:hypothetical protein
VKRRPARRTKTGNTNEPQSRLEEQLQGPTNGEASDLKLVTANEAEQTAAREKASNVVAMSMTEGITDVPTTVVVPETIRTNNTTPTKSDSKGVDPNHPHAAHVQIVNHDTAEITGGRRKIAVTGFATSSRGHIPIDDPEWEIWGLNQFYRHVDRADRWFEIHHNWNEHVVEGTDYTPDLNNLGIPIYMKDCVPSIPNSVRFPIERLSKQFSRYWTSTVAFMLGAAIDALLTPESRGTDRPVAIEGAEIGIYGIDLTVGSEYFYQKCCVEYFVGVAVGAGIRVTIPEESAVCKGTWIYGYEDEPDYGVISLSMLEARLTALRQNHAKAVATAQTIEGCIQETQHYHRVLQLKQRGAMVQIGGKYV